MIPGMGPQFGFSSQMSREAYKAAVTALHGSSNIVRWVFADGAVVTSGDAIDSFLSEGGASCALTGGTKATRVMVGGKTAALFTSATPGTYSLNVSTTVVRAAHAVTRYDDELPPTAQTDLVFALGVRLSALTSTLWGGNGTIYKNGETTLTLDGTACAVSGVLAADPATGSASISRSASANAWGGLMFMVMLFGAGYAPSQTTLRAQYALDKKYWGIP